MPRFDPAILNFSAGELSPRLKGRVDLEKYTQGCETMENYFPSATGAAIRRGGSKYIATAKTGISKIRLQVLDKSDGKTVHVHIDDDYIQVLYTSASAEIEYVSSGGSPVQVASPYSANDLDELKFVQDPRNNHLIVLHPDYAPRILIVTYTGSYPTSFVFNTISFTDAPSGWSTFPPTCGTIFQQRLYLSGKVNDPGTVWASEVDNYYTFTPGTGTDSFSFTIAYEGIGKVEWLAGRRTTLMIGTAEGEYELVAPNDEEIISSANLRVERQTNHGSAEYLPVLFLGSDLGFVQKSLRKVLSTRYAFERDSNIVQDLNILSDHILGVNEGRVIQATSVTFTEILAFFVLSTWDVIVLTYDISANIFGWSRLKLAVESAGVAGIDSVSIGRGTRWPSELDIVLAVRRIIDSTSYTYIERLTYSLRYPRVAASPPYVSQTEYGEYLDSSIYIANSPTESATVSGLSHLEGETVTAVVTSVDNDVFYAVHEDLEVSSGEITLPYTVSEALVGLPFTSTLKTMPIEGGNPIGTAQGRTKRISKAYVRVYDTLDIKVNGEECVIEQDDEDEPELFTGDLEVNIDDGYDSDGQITVTQDGPFPGTILGIYPVVRTQ